MEVELTPSVDTCADCGGRLRRIGEDVAEELKFVPGRFIVNRIVRPRLTCICCERFRQPRCLPAPSTVAAPVQASAHMCWLAKYTDHLPLYPHV